MAIRIQAVDDAHWYRVTQTPNESGFSYSVEACHEEGLRGARKAGNIYPSFTSVDKMIHKEMIVNWKIGHALKASRNLPPLTGEDDESWAKRVMEHAEENMSTGRELGTRVHKAIEDNCASEDDIVPFLEAARRFIAQNAVRTIYQETRLFLPSLGLAGTCDFIFEDRYNRVVFGDWKTVKPFRGKLALRDSYPAQLSGYRQAVRETHPALANREMVCVSLLLNSQEPGKDVEAHWLNEEQLTEGYSRLMAAAWLWSQEKDFWPIGKWMLGRKEILDKEQHVPAF